MGPNRRALEREEARAREKQRRLEDEARAADAADAVAMIEAWNARLATGWRVLWSPTLGAAALAGYRWLTVYCPGCGTVKDVDLAKVERHPGGVDIEPDPVAVMPDMPPKRALCADQAPR
jgi:hypothetical protein